MRWLQLTDLHVGMKGWKSQESAIHDLVKAIADAPLATSLDAIIVTGDVAYSGQAHEYKKFISDVLEPIRALPMARDALLITVPGNHDLNCDTSHPITWDTLGQSRTPYFFDESPEGKQIRSPRAVSFSDYAEFTQTANALSPNPLIEVSAAPRQLEIRGRKINIIGTNTALFSDKDPTLIDEEKTPAPTPSLRTRLHSAEPAEHTLILAHHPIEWFLHVNREPLKSLLVDHDAIYIHGHMHDIRARFSPNGILTLGFGATYQAAPDAAASPYYKNTFAFCELDTDLHVLFYQWDSVHGRWVTVTTLPIEFRDPSPILSGGFRLPMPKPNPRRRGVPQARSSASSNVVPPKITSIMSIGEMQPEDWIGILLRGHLLESRDVKKEDLIFEPDNSSPEKASFTYRSPAGRHRIVCILGPGHILSQGEVESANTYLDLHDLASYSIISFGEMAADARTVYLKLKTKKPLRILAKGDVVEILSAARSIAQKDHMSALDGTAVAVALLIAQSELILLVSERQCESWFYVLPENGSPVPESETLIRTLRLAMPQFAETEYRPPGSNSTAREQKAPHQAPFDRAEYMKACHREFNSVRYTALATIGLRFHNVTLEELYVETNAHSGANRGVTVGDALSRAIDDTLKGLQLDEPLRTQLEAQLRHQLGAASTGETRAARWLYQEHRSLLVLGDPGSGKTCFVKHEVMTYCRSEEPWYTKHTPVFVPLAEAARIFSAGDDLIDIASALSGKRGLKISPIHLRELVSKGATAFFFDGVDEVVSVDKRAQLIDAIARLMDLARPLGNRFVVTSRPAAVQLVDMPEALEVISLRGLTTDEMRTLATRVLAIRFSEGAEGVRIGLDRLNAQDKSLVDQLIQDCKTTPGIARLARNPLLLTLLVMIYANSGPLAAKRHRVYAQAVQTLVSVRSREAGQKVFSEADLRRRLGAVALSVYQNPDGGIPSRADVCRCLMSIISTERNAVVHAAEADKFIQEVAESTGLIVIHSTSKTEQPQAETITFMHHSFLEYYAAIGMYSSADYVGKLTELARQPRWREVITLLAGIVGDNNDASTLVDELLSPQDPTERITLDLLNFAFDCALECDVPPETAQRKLLRRVDDVVRGGSARLDAVLRARLGERLGKLLATSGSRDLLRVIGDGLRDQDEYVAAAYVDLLGYIAALSDIDESVLVEFDATCKRRDPIIVTSICGSMARSTQLRRPNSLEALKDATKGNAGERYGAVKAVAESSGLAKDIQPEIIRLLDDPQGAVSRSAAFAMLNSRASIDTSDGRQRSILLKVLSNLENATETDLSTMTSVPFSKDHVDQLLSSPDIVDRLIGLRVLPWMRGQEQFVHDRIMSAVRRDMTRSDVARQEVVVALAALQVAPTAQKLLRLADVDFIRTLLLAKTKDVRIAACEVLGIIKSTTEPHGNAKPIESYLQQHDQGKEFQCAVKALVQCGAESPEVAKIITELTTDRLHRGQEKRGRDSSDILALLRSCQQIRTDLDDIFVAKLRTIVTSRAVGDEMRREVAATYVAVARPSKAIVDTLITWLRRPPPKFENGALYATALFLQKCRRRFEYVREVYPHLDRLLSVLLDYAKKIHVFRLKNDDSATTNLRMAVEEAQQMLNAYGEFARRKVA